MVDRDGGGARLGHVGLVVRDLSLMESYYSEVLGLTVNDRGMSARRGWEMVFLSGERGVHHALVLVAGQASTDGRLDHVAFAVPSLSDLRDVRDRARARGAQGLRQANHGNAWSLYFTDPEGNAIEVFVAGPIAMAQPFAGPLDLDRSDGDIVADTKRLCGRGSDRP